MKIIYVCLICLFSSVSTHAQMPELYKDEFSSNKNQWEGKTDYVSAKIDSGKLVVTGDAAEYLKKIAVPIDTAKPYSVSVVTSAKLTGIDPRLLSDDLATGSGFIFGSNHFSSYEFLVYSDGVWALFEISNGKSKTIASEKNTAILKGLGTPNTLKLISSSGQWEFLINDKSVYTLKARKYFGNSFGLSKEKRHCISSYDDFIISGTSLKITNGKLCSVLDKLYRSGANAFGNLQGRHIKGAGRLEDKVCTSLIWPEADSTATITYKSYDAFFNGTVKNFITFDQAKKHMISLIPTLKKCMPGYVFLDYDDYISFWNSTVANKPSTAELRIQKHMVAGGTQKGFDLVLIIRSISFY